MCIIIYSPDGHIPAHHLRRSLEANPHGWGLMVHDGERTVVAKGMVPEEFWPVWETRPPGPVVFHARITSHGTTDLDNCHPFEVPGHDLHMAHNGIIHECARKDTKLSDTRRFVRDILTELPVGFLESEAHLRLIAKFVGHSKLVFMSGEGKVTIVNAELGHWYRPHHKGRMKRWYSNESYLPPKPVKKDDTPWWAKSRPAHSGLFAELKPMSSGVIDPSCDGDECEANYARRTGVFSMINDEVVSRPS